MYAQQIQLTNCLFIRLVSNSNKQQQKNIYTVFGIEIGIPIQYIEGGPHRINQEIFRRKPLKSTPHPI